MLRYLSDRGAVPILILIAVGFGIYVNSLNGAFVWDDNPGVVDNVYLREWRYLPSLVSENINAGAGMRGPYYRPVLMLSFFIDYRIWGLDVLGYHLTSVVLHISAALCLYWLLHILAKDRLLAFFATFLFLLHPLQVESVAYISNRSDLLVSVFMLLFFLLYLKHIQRRSYGLLSLACLCLGLAFLTKENSLVFPVLVPVYHIVFRRKYSLKAFSVIGGISASYLLVRVTLMKADVPLNAGYLLSAWQRLPGLFAAISGYFRILLFPMNLHMDYGKGLYTFNDPRVLFGIIIAAGLFVSAFRLRDKRPMISFFTLWLLVMLIPVSNIIFPLHAFMAERFLYFPSIGFFVILAAGLSFIHKIRETRIPAMCLVIILGAGYAFLTVKQNKYWRDPSLFYERTLELNPRSEQSYNNLALLYRAEGNLDGAVRLLNKAVELKPGYMNAYNSLAIIYRDSGRIDEAFSTIESALKIDPGYVAGLNTLGTLYVKKKEYDRAIEIFQKAVRVAPGCRDAHNNLAVVYYASGRYKLAAEHCKRALESGVDVDPEFLRKISEIENRVHH